MPAEATEVPQAAAAPGIFRGAPVLIKGLQGAAQYNGCKGTVTAGPYDNGRYEVAIQKDGEEKKLDIKPANFDLDHEALKEYVMQKRAAALKRSPPIEDLGMFWQKGKGLSAKAIMSRGSVVPELEENCVLLRVDKFAFSHMSLGYLMKGFTRTFGAYHNFFSAKDEGLYRSACWGYCTVVESAHKAVEVGTRLYGLVPPSKYQMNLVGGTIPAGSKGEPAVVELTMEGVPFNLRRFQESEVVPASEASENSDPNHEDWKILLKEIYTMAFYIDEQLLTETGMIGAVIISCASSKIGMALAYCLRMREMRYVVGFTHAEHLDFVKSTDLYHDVFSYDQADQLPTNHTMVYIDLKCDGELRQNVTMRLGTNLMYNMLVGPSVFQKRMKDQVFEKRAREVIFDESAWRCRRRMVAEVTKTGRNEKLKYSFKSFIEKMKKVLKLKHVSGPEALTKMYDEIYSNTNPPNVAYICTLHDNAFEGEELWGA